jgi:hypothetical protein
MLKKDFSKKIIYFFEFFRGLSEIFKYIQYSLESPNRELSKNYFTINNYKNYTTVARVIVF